MAFPRVIKRSPNRRRGTDAAPPELRSPGAAAPVALVVFAPAPRQPVPVSAWARAPLAPRRLGSPLPSSCASSPRESSAPRPSGRRELARCAPFAECGADPWACRTRVCIGVAKGRVIARRYLSSGERGVCDGCSWADGEVRRLRIRRLPSREKRKSRDCLSVPLFIVDLSKRPGPSSTRSVREQAEGRVLAASCKVSKRRRPCASPLPTRQAPLRRRVDDAGGACVW